MKPTPALFLFALGLLQGCGPQVEPLPFEPAGVSAAPNPSEFGPFPVGVRTVELSDTGRRKLDGSPRRLVTELWYPAVPDAREGAGEVYDVRTLLSEEQRLKTAHVIPPLLATRAVRDAAPSSRGPFPVVMFSHGQGGIRWQSTYLTVLLASHGYVVVSPDHEGNTLVDGLNGELSLTTEGIDSRPQDIIYLLNWLHRLKEADPLYGKLDLTRIGMTGHSFGALTALRVAAMDKRIRVIIPQTPVDADIAWLGLPRPVELGIPVMLQGSRRDKTLPWDAHVETTWKQLSPPRYLLELVTGGHYTYSDLCGLDLITLAEQLELAQANDVKKVLGDGCGPEAPPASVAQPMINHFTVALFNAELRQSPLATEQLSQLAADELGAGVATFTAER